MTGILKVTDADLIDQNDSDTLLLCLIPAGKIRLKKSEYEILKELFYENIEVIEIEPEPEPPDPDEYISRDEIPEYLWKFIKYAQTKPANISADSYLHMCQLLQALPQRISNDAIFNWTDKNFYALQLGYNNSISISSDGYYFKNGQVIQTKNYINPRTDNFKFIGIIKFTSKTAQQTIFHLADVSNTTNVYKYMALHTTSTSGIVFKTRASSATSLPTYNTNVTLSNWDISTPVTVTVAGKYETGDTYYDVTLNVRNATTDGNITNEYNPDSIPLNRIPNGTLIERINSFVYRSSGATVNTTVSGNKYFQYYDLENQNTGNTTIIKFDDSKIIDDKLLVIV